MSVVNRALNIKECELNRLPLMLIVINISNETRALCQY